MPLLFQLTRSRVKAKVENARALELEIHLHGAILKRQSIPERADVHVLGKLAGAQHTFLHIELARVDSKALRQAVSIECFLEQFPALGAKRRLQFRRRNFKCHEKNEHLNGADETKR